MFLRRIIAILISIVIVASGLQFLRSLGMFNLIKNINAEVKIAPAKKLDYTGDLKDAKFEKYLIVVNEEEENSLKITSQLIKTLNYIKKDYEIVNFNKLNSFLDSNIEQSKYLNNFDCVLFTFERLDNIDNFDLFLDYVYSGKSLILLERPVIDKTFKQYYRYFGIKSYQDKLNNNSKGIKVISNILIGAEGFNTNIEEIKNSSITLELKDNGDNDNGDNDLNNLNLNLELYLTSYDGNPLCWKCSYGAGKFILFNGTALNEKQNRGLITSILSLYSDIFIYPIANIKLVCIDDFPAPIPQGINDEIFEEFSRNIPQFYREIWWPDMLKFSKKYNIKYSCFVIETYNNKTTPPFEKGSSNAMKDLMLYGREILANEGEIGLHGYNHQPLVFEGYIKQDLGYNPWNSIDDMKSSIEQLIRFINSVFGHYELNAYVPPSNILSPEGREAVKLANPNLNVIASVYLPNKEGDIYEQEFENASDGIVEFPRLTAGYEKTDEKLWIIYNGINAYGIFAHFIHPDDVLDVKRNNNKSWSELSKEFEELLAEVNSKYYWLRSYTISPATVELIKYLEAKPYIEYRKSNNNKNDNDNNIQINIYTDNFRQNVYCILKTKKEILSSVSCEYEKISDNAYLLTLKENVCSLYLK